MVYKEAILIDDREAEHIRRVLSGRETMGEGDAVIHTAVFPDGMRMDVVARSKGRASWVEATLFDGEGRVVGSTGPEEGYFGWRAIGNGDDIYVVNVAPETPPITKERIAVGIEKGLVRFAPEPGADHGTARHIGGNCFWFGGFTAEEEDPEQYLEDVPAEDVVDEAYDALSSLRLTMETAGTYARCDEFLTEHGV